MQSIKIKIKMFNFVNDINILIYDRIMKSICKTLSWIHNIYVKWAWIHDITFACMNLHTSLAS